MRSGNDRRGSTSSRRTGSAILRGNPEERSTKARLIARLRNAKVALLISKFVEGQAPTAEMAVTPPSIRKSAPTTYAESSDAR